MKKVLLTIALFVAFGSMAFAIDGVCTVTGTGKFKIYKAHGLTMRTICDVDLGWILPGQKKTFTGCTPLTFLVDGAGTGSVGGSDPNPPYVINAKVHWSLPKGPKDFTVDGLTLKTVVEYGTDGCPPGTDDYTQLGFDGIGACYVKPLCIEAPCTLPDVGKVVCFPVTVTCAYDTIQ
ncbi:MAG: hypothetical protein ACM3U1_00785 [Chloroflexota bacterium]